MSGTSFLRDGIAATLSYLSKIIQEGHLSRFYSRREQNRDTFGKYVTPEIRDQILSGRIPLHGERQIATLLFSDLRDFTIYVEANDPENAI